MLAAASSPAYWASRAELSCSGLALWVLRTGEDRRERLLDKAISEISTSSSQNLPSIFLNIFS